MSVICGQCGNIIFVSNRENWTTRKDRPEITCDKCNPRQSIPVRYACKYCGR